MVARSLGVGEVAGSNPVGPTIYFLRGYYKDQNMPQIISGYLFPGICLTGGFNALASQTLPMPPSHDFGVEVYRQPLLAGIEFKLMKSGYVLCDFSKWSKGSNWESEEENYAEWIRSNASPFLSQEELMLKEEERFDKRQNRKTGG